MKICLSCGKGLPKPGGGWKCPACAYQPVLKNTWPIFAPELSNQNEGFDIQLFSQLAAIESENFWYCARNELLVWAFGKYFPQAENFFEIGCGTGFALGGFHRSFPGLALYGSDLYDRALEYSAERAPSARLFQMDARKIPFQDEFDAIGAFDVLEHIEEDEVVLSQIFQALKPGGGLLVTVPQHPFLWSDYDVLDHHVRRYRADELTAKVRRAGFEIIRTTSFVSLLLPAMMASRLTYRKADSKKNVIAAFHKKGAVNAVLKKIMAFERGLIRLGCPLPLGGSLLLIAVKSLAANAGLQKTIPEYSR